MSLTNIARPTLHRWLPAQRRQRLVRYTLGSVVATVSSFLGFAISYALGAPPAAAAAVAFVAGAIPNWALNRHWAWGRRGPVHVGREVVVYALISVASYLVSAATTSWGDRVAPDLTHDHLVRVGFVAGVYVATYGVLFLARYAAYSKFVFRSAAATAAPPEQDSSAAPALDGSSRSNSSNRKNRPYIPAVRAAAIDDFHRRYPDLVFAPAVAVIAALNERESIGAVLDAIPRTACGVAVDTLVIDDGSTDGTADVVRAQDGVYLARLERNAGHGVALRLGYQLASEHGASYVVTLDADMQWDPAELPVVLEPLAAGDADFVIGSRTLGTAETDDSLRHAGVRVFARLVSLLTGTHVTDTSSGFRAMSTEVTQTVPQVQVQYQTSELLIGAIYHGYRIAERPITMHKRLAGESKKGHNLLYGARYARVILTTWWRERRRARRAGRRAGR